MNIGIVTTWFERGAAYVSRQYKEVLEKEHNVFIYARSGEEYAIGNPDWDGDQVTWGKKINSPFAGTVLQKSTFKKWIDTNSIEVVLFNEQQWFQPVVWCKEWQIKTIAYIDYYTERTIPLFEVYDMLICNTKRHFSAFDWHKGAIYLPWGTNIDVFKPKVNGENLVNEEFVTFFHSCGMNIDRKGTRILIQAFADAKKAKKLIIHTQKEINDKDLVPLIEELVAAGRLEIINKTVSAPGLYFLGDVYIYPTILEGIGLTIAEAISSGLGTVVPDNGPMNEFVINEYNGNLIKLDKCYARHDGYYWPVCTSSVQDLVVIINDLAGDKNKVLTMKKNARSSAEANLSFEKNAQHLTALIGNLDFTPISKKLKSSVDKFDNAGFKKFNKLYMIFPSFFNLIWKKVL
mgnify:CR=1 FL=1